MRRFADDDLVLATTLCLLMSVGATPEADAAVAIRHSMYAGLVESIGGQVVDEHARVLGGDLKDETSLRVVESVLHARWTAERLIASTGALLAKRLSPEEIDAALAPMMFPVRSMTWTRGNATPLAPPASGGRDRTALARRIAAHLPDEDFVRALLNEAAGMLGDVIELSATSDAHRQLVRDDFLRSFAQQLQSLHGGDARTAAVLVRYRDEPTDHLRQLAEALETEAWQRLQRAVAESLVAAVRQVRADTAKALPVALAAAGVEPCPPITRTDAGCVFVFAQAPGHQTGGCTAVGPLTIMSEAKCGQRVRACGRVEQRCDCQ